MPEPLQTKEKGCLNGWSLGHMMFQGSAAGLYSLDVTTNQRSGGGA